MPEIPVDEDDNPFATENEVRLPWELHAASPSRNPLLAHDLDESKLSRDISLASDS